MADTISGSDADGSTSDELVDQAAQPVELAAGRRVGLDARHQRDDVVGVDLDGATRRRRAGRGAARRCGRRGRRPARCGGRRAAAPGPTPRSRRSSALDRPRLARRRARRSARRAPAAGGRPSEGPGDGERLALAAGEARPRAGAGRGSSMPRLVEQRRGPRRACRPRTAARPGSSRPRKRLATTSRLSHSARSCHTTARPWPARPAGGPAADRRPRRAGVEARAPATHWTSVDLPAPFSPTSATSSPGAQVEVDAVEHDRGAEPATTPRAESTGPFGCARPCSRPVCPTTPWPSRATGCDQWAWVGRRGPNTRSGAGA